MWKSTHTQRQNIYPKDATRNVSKRWWEKVSGRTFRKQIRCTRNHNLPSFSVFTLEAESHRSWLEIGQKLQSMAQDCSAVSRDIKTGCCKLAADTRCLAMYIFPDDGVQKEGVYLSAMGVSVVRLIIKGHFYICNIPAYRDLFVMSISLFDACPLKLSANETFACLLTELWWRRKLLHSNVRHRLGSWSCRHTKYHWTFDFEHNSLITDSFFLRNLKKGNGIKTHVKNSKPRQRMSGYKSKENPKVFDFRDWIDVAKVRLGCYYGRQHENLKIGHLICDPLDNTSNTESLMMTNFLASSEWHFVMTLGLRANKRNE